MGGKGLAGKRAKAGRGMEGLPSVRLKNTEVNKKHVQYAKFFKEHLFFIFFCSSLIFFQLSVCMGKGTGVFRQGGR